MNITDNFHTIPVAEWKATDSLVITDVADQGEIYEIWRRSDYKTVAFLFDSTVRTRTTAENWVKTRSSEQVLKDEMTRSIVLKVFDDEERIVGCVAYRPNVLDSQDEFMTEGEVKKLAHRTMMGVRKQAIAMDVQHDFQDRPDVWIVESYIARGDIADLGILKGDWVVVVKIDNDEVWEKVKSGEIASFSFAGRAQAEALEDIPEGVGEAA